MTSIESMSSLPSESQTLLEAVYPIGNIPEDSFNTNELPFDRVYLDLTDEIHSTLHHKDCKYFCFFICLLLLIS